MIYVLYLVTGFMAAVLGALPPGAVNLSVMYTTISRGSTFAFPMVVSAAIGEIILAVTALHCAALVEEYVLMNIFIQYIIAALLLLIGIVLFFKKTPLAPTTLQLPRRYNTLLKVFLLAVLNPPVLIFWLVAFTYLATRVNISFQMSIWFLSVLFFAGVFMGKVFTLWLYIQLSNQVRKHVRNITLLVNKAVGVLLVLVGIIQWVKLVNA